ncbi:MAG: hypothetical protein ACJ73S_17720 [Mycobacteriales bacterium]
MAGRTWSPDAARGELGAGPGIALRWLAAVPLLAAALVGPVLGLAAVQAWAQARIHLPFGAHHTFGGEFGHAVRVAVLAYLYPYLIGAIVLACNRRAVSTWPKTCLIMLAIPLGAAALAGGLLFGLVGPDGSADRPYLLIVPAAAALWAAGYGLALLAVRVLSRPLAADLVASGMEIPFPLRGPGRLRVQYDRLVLDAGHSRVGISWADLGRVWSEPVARESRAALPYGIGLELTGGPVLHVEGAGQSWTLPVAETDAAGMVAVIKGRAGYARSRPGFATRAEYQRAHAGELRDRARAAMRAVDFSTPFPSPTNGKGATIVTMIACPSMAAICLAALIPPLGHHLQLGGVNATLGALVWGAIGAVALRRYTRYLTARRYLEVHPT